MIIKNGLVFHEDKTFSVGDVYIEKGKFVATEAETTDKTVVDAKGMYVVPGLVDIHSHGAVGCDFSDGDAEGVKKILKYEYSVGVTTYLPTSMTLSKEELLRNFAAFKDLKDEKNSAYPIAINMEGPFIDPKKKGAQAEWNIAKATEEFFDEVNEASGNKIKLVTLAPNMDGAMEFIDAVHDRVHISLGHTTTDFTTATEAFKRGADHVTHLYNAMQPFAHRDPGLIGAAFDAKDAYVELICDGIHIHPTVIRATFEMFKDRVCMISDSMRAIGLDDGIYDLGGQEVHVKGKLATLADGTLAGSASNLMDCVHRNLEFGVPKEEVFAAATMNPAKSIGVFDEVGSIAPGKRADVLLLNEKFDLVKIIGANDTK